MKQSPSMSRDEVLYAFAVEQGDDNETLMSYLATYPQYAADLLALSGEFEVPVSDRTLSPTEQQRVAAAVSRFREGVGHPDVLDFSDNAIQMAVEKLQLPRQVFLSFRERRVDFASVPLRFLERLADILESSLDQLKVFLLQPPLVSAARFSKSRSKPTVATKVPFEKILHDARVDPERVDELINGGE